MTQTFHDELLFEFLNFGHWTLFDICNFNHSMNFQQSKSPLGIKQSLDPRMPFMDEHSLKGYYRHLGSLVQTFRVCSDLNQAVGVDHGVDKA